MSKIPLETCRQFYFEDIVLRETTLNPADHDIAKKTEAYCHERVEMLLEKAGEENKPDRGLSHKSAPKTDHLDENCFDG